MARVSLGSVHLSHHHSTEITLLVVYLRVRFYRPGPLFDKLNVPLFRRKYKCVPFFLESSALTGLVQVSNPLILSNKALRRLLRRAAYDNRVRVHYCMLRNEHTGG